MGCTSSSVKDPYASGYKEITYYKKTGNYSTRIVEDNKKKPHVPQEIMKKSK